MKTAKRFLFTITLTLMLGISAIGGEMNTPTAAPPPPPPTAMLADPTEPGDVGSSELSFEILFALLSLF